MSGNLYAVSIWVACAVTILLFVSSLLFCNKRWNPGYMRSFIVYTSVNLVATFLPLVYPPIQYISYAIFTIFETVYFAYLMYRLLRGKIAKQIVLTMLLMWFVLMVGQIYRGGWDTVATFGTLCEAIASIIACLLWYREIFLFPVERRLEYTPAFWFVTAIFFYSAILPPTLLFSERAFKYAGRDFGLALWSINNYAQVIAYSLFIIGMLCRRKLPSF